MAQLKIDVKTKTFTTRLTRRMQEARLSEQEVARRMNVEPALVRRWKFGNAYPNDMMLCRLANLLKLDVDYLSGEERAKETASLSEQRALTAEQQLLEGVQIDDVIHRHGYQDARDLFVAITRYTKAPPFTDDEKGYFYKNIRARMEEKGITCTQMCWSVGVGKSVIDAWRSGSRMPARCLIPRVASILGMSGRELLGGPPLPEDREKTAPPLLKVPETVQKDAAAREESGSLSIRVRYAADAKGKYADYSFDGAMFSVKFTAPLTGITPETLVDIGEEMQSAAVAMIR